MTDSEAHRESTTPTCPLRRGQPDNHTARGAVHLLRCLVPTVISLLDFRGVVAASSPEPRLGPGVAVVHHRIGGCLGLEHQRLGRMIRPSTGRSGRPHPAGRTSHEEGNGVSRLAAQTLGRAALWSQLRHHAVSPAVICAHIGRWRPGWSVNLLSRTLSSRHHQGSGMTA